MTDTQDAARLLAHTFEHMTDAVVTADAQHRVVHFNAAAERLWGLARESVIGRMLGSLLPSADHPATLADDAAEIRVSRPDGSIAWGALRVTRLPAASHIRHVLFIHDITLQRQAHTQQRLMALGLDATDSAVIVTDENLRIVHVNEGFTRLLGWTAADAIGRHPRDLLFASPHSPRTHFDDITARLAAGRRFHLDERICDNRQRSLWCAMQITPILDEAGRLTDTVTVLTDITDTRMHEALQQKVLAALVRDQPLAEVMTLICHEVERLAPEVVASILQVDDEGRLHPLASPSLPAYFARAIDGAAIGPATGSCGTAAWRGEAVLVTDIATDPLWAAYKQLTLPLGLVACWSSPITGGDGRVVGTFAFYYRDHRGPTPLHQRLVEVSVHLCAIALEREAARARIRQLAFYDGLTGLPNRSLLQVQANQAIARANQARERLAVLFVDLDRFKQVNDSLGHPAGDDLLRTVAARLQGQVSESDIVGRLSGDEFAIVLTPCDATRATDMAEQLQAALAVPCRLGDIPLTPSASIGIALFPENGRDMNTLLRCADLAMYQAKTGQRGHFSFFSDEMNLLAQQRLELEAALREALRQGALHLHYQPQIDLKDGQLYGVEALARWQHPELGNIPPIRFIPLAEECGLIGELSHWALREACRQLADWRSRGLAIPAVSVNLSPTNFHDLDLPDKIAATLAQYALAPSDLTVEITESTLLDTHPSTMKTIQAVHAQGVRLAMDDFGTGYSSLGYLRRLPVSELKLDKSFLGDLVQNEATRALTHAVIRIGESLRLMVVAEGVEDGQQREVLKAQGYQVAQGYLFSPPLPPAELERWLQQHTR